jgi:hypothetical protein
MVDLLFMRCKDIVVLDVWIDIYVNMLLYACSNQTSLLGLVRGTCALDGIILS